MFENLNVHFNVHFRNLGVGMTPWAKFEDRQCIVLLMQIQNMALYLQAGSLIGFEQ